MALQLWRNLYIWYLCTLCATSEITNSEIHETHEIMKRLRSFVAYNKGNKISKIISFLWSIQMHVDINCVWIPFFCSFGNFFYYRTKSKLHGDSWKIFWQRGELSIVKMKVICVRALSARYNEHQLIYVSKILWRKYVLQSHPPPRTLIKLMPESLAHLMIESGT